jgi:hypothetical protein
VSNPSEALAAHILDRLVDEGLVLPDDVHEALRKFAAGEMTAEDWRRYVGKTAGVEEGE